MTHEHHDREVIVTDRGSSAGTILGVIIVVLLLAAVWWFALGPGAGRGGQGGGSDTQNPAPTLEIQPPSS